MAEDKRAPEQDPFAPDFDVLLCGGPLHQIFRYVARPISAMPVIPVGKPR